MSEAWRAIPGFEGAYEVSDLGRVRSLDRCWMQEGRGGNVHLHRKTGKVLRPGATTSGHVTVVLGREGGSKTVHSLVTSAFIGPCPQGQEVRHLDGVPTHNARSNLEYATRTRNSQDKKWHAGASTYHLRPADVFDIKRRLGPFGAGVELSREYGVAQSTISAIKHDKFHKDIVL